MINCDQHDYIEIVCMYRYPVKITLASGDIVEGIAMDTARDEQHAECIKIGDEKNQQLIVLDEIKTLEVTEENPHVRRVDFSS